ncbi:hypothetical protein [Nostoc sp.]|uniref:hypothetical protein n=1 Tax=Nostoc sp. TaxID=1180 RepID=UPI002FFD5516
MDESVERKRSDRLHQFFKIGDRCQPEKPNSIPTFLITNYEFVLSVAEVLRITN